MIAALSALELRAQYAARAISPRDAVEAMLTRIEQYRWVGAFYQVDAGGARDAAREAEARYASGEPRSLLDGIPVSIKDHIAVRGMRTARGGLDGPGIEADEDAPVTARLREAGAILIGKTTMPELSVVPDTASARFGITRNPWDRERSPGGSSGGAAAAVAAGLGPIAIGSDGGGSIRLPAAYTNNVGFKPTHALIPYWPGATDRTVVGPITRTVADAAAVMEVVARFDGRDWMETPGERDSFALDGARAAGRSRFAFSPTLGFVQVEPGVAAAVRAAVDLLEAVGGSVEEFERPFRSAEDIYYTIATLRFHGRTLPPGATSPALQRVYQHAARLTIADVNRYYDERDALGGEMMRLFGAYDFIVTPTAPAVAPPVGTFYPGGDPLGAEGRNTIAFTAPFNLLHLPAISVPCGFSDGLPVGVQIAGPKGSDAALLRIADRLERALAARGLRTATFAV